MKGSTRHGGALGRLLACGLLAGLLAACGGQDGGGTDTGQSESEQGGTDGGELVVYAGRSEELVGPLFERFTEETGIGVAARYGDTAEMAATILEEGANSPADLYFAQDAGALGALHSEGRLVELPQALLDRVDTRFRSPDGTWVGTSGRARTLAYNTDQVSEQELPGSVLELTEPQWQGRVGWAPTNGSFQAFVTAMRVELGDDATLQWLEGMLANGVTEYENNTAQVEAAGRGEIDVGLVNHYYLYRFLEEDPQFSVENLFLGDGDIGALVNIAGVGVLDTSGRQELAFELVDFLLTPSAQEYVAQEVFEFPLIAGVQGDPRLPSIDDIRTPDMDLSDLEDLEGTLALLRQAGVLP